MSNTAETVQKYGRSSELGRLRMLKTKELSRDMEYALLNGVQSSGSGSTPRSGQRQRTPSASCSAARPPPSR